MLFSNEGCLIARSGDFRILLVWTCNEVAEAIASVLFPPSVSNVKWKKYLASLVASLFFRNYCSDCDHPAFNLLVSYGRIGQVSEIVHFFADASQIVYNCTPENFVHALPILSSSRCWSRAAFDYILSIRKAIAAAFQVVEYWRYCVKYMCDRNCRFISEFCMS